MSSSDTDLILVCGSRQFPVHRQVLSQVSPVFDTLVADTDTETETEATDDNNNTKNRVVVDSLSERELVKILKFLYTGDIKFEDDCVKILTAANLYQVRN